MTKKEIAMRLRAVNFADERRVLDCCGKYKKVFAHDKFHDLIEKTKEILDYFDCDISVADYKLSICYGGNGRINMDLGKLPDFMVDELSNIIIRRQS